MSLLIDQYHVTEADLLAIDAEISDIATAEQLTLTGDSGILARSWSDCVAELQGKMTAFVSQPVMTMPYQLTATFGGNRARVRIDQMIVGYGGLPMSPVHRWMAARALRAFYRAASNRKLNDRYQRKYDDAEQYVREAWLQMCQVGIATAYAPVPCPGNLLDPFGRFNATDHLEVIDGASAQSTTYQVAISWLTSQGTESGPSAVLTQAIGTGKQLRIKIDGLQQGSPLAPQPPVSGWYVYAGLSGARLRKQNTTATPIDTTYYDLALTPSTSGAVMGTGQEPDVFVPVQNLLMRS